MTNADKFKNIFELYATELWSMPEKDFLKWLNSEAMNCSEIPNNSDTISRQQAVDALADMHCKSDEDGYVWIIRSDAWARIDALPSVTPKQKTGKWINANDGKWNTVEVLKCSACGEIDNRMYRTDNYCPNCGARMTEDV